MKRIQLRNHNTAFESRELAIQFFHDLADDATVRGQKFGESLYAEPMVAKYIDENGDTQIILAIGVDGGKSEYHLIDSAKLAKDIELLESETAGLASDLEGEIARAIAAESAITASMAKAQTTLSAITPTESNVRDEYVLTNADGDVLGDHIKVYKDSALVAAQIGYKDAALKVVDGEYVKDENGDYVFVYENMDTTTEYLYLIYQNTDGNLAMVAIDFEKFIVESEVGNGLQVDDNTHKISIKVDVADEGYLAVTENGIKTEGIDDAIDAAKNEAMAYAEGIVGSAATDISKNKIISKDVVLTPTASGVNLTIQTDEKTITKFASAGTIYDTNVAVFGTLLTMKKVTPTDAAIKDAYELQDGNGERIGDTIEITKESSLSRVYLSKSGDVIDPNTGNIISYGAGDDTLNFVYLKADGTYELVEVEISKYFTDAHFGKGLQNLDGVISIATPNDEQYLYVGEDIIGTSGITEAINAAKDEAKDYADGLAATINNTIDTLATKDELAIAVSSAKTEMQGVVAAAVSDAITETEAYTDGKIDDVLDEINTNKVVDVVYDMDTNSPKFIQLRLADGTLTDGFDASGFLVDGVLTSVDLVGDNLVFIWNDDENTRIEVPLTKFSDVYTVATGSTPFLKIEGKEVSAIVDHDGGYGKTLASTDYVDNVDDKVDALSSATEANTNAIATLNGNVQTPGSVLHTMDDKILVAGLPITNISVEEARQHSLMKVLKLNGENWYFASSLAKDMFYVPASGDPVNLNTYISDLKNEINDLKDRVTALENATIDEAAVKNIIKNYLEGTDKEIMIRENNDKLKIGFTDDAIFGDMNN